MSISTETIATVKIADTGIREDAAYALAQAELAAAYPLDVPGFLSQDYDAGHYSYDFRLTPNAA